MAETQTELLQIALRQVADKIRSEIEVGTTKSELNPREVDSRRAVARVEYSAGGGLQTHIHWEPAKITTWIDASFTVQKRVIESEEYKALIALTTKESEAELPKTIAEFVRRLAEYHLTHPSSAQDKQTHFIDVFVAELERKPIEHSVKVFLEWLSVPEKPVTFAFGETAYLLRRLEPDDLIENQRYGFPSYCPTAILVMNRPEVRPEAIDVMVREAEVILRLYKVGSSRVAFYWRYSESLLGESLGAQGHERTIEPLQKTELNEVESERLPAFWQLMSGALPAAYSASPFGATDPTLIAFQRYSDALLKNGVKERRAANAAMGLEGLFVKAGEKELVGLRLSTRCAKTLSYFDLNPLDVRKKVKDGYDVRSTYLHGHQLTNDNRKAMKKYGGLDRFLPELIEYLRLAIIFRVFLKIKYDSMSKDDFLSKLDDSFIDKRSDEELTQMAAVVIAAANAWK